MIAERVEKMYREAHQMVSDAKSMLEKGGELTDQQSQDINRWLSQAEEIEKRAKQLESVLEREESLAREQSRFTLDDEKAKKDAALAKAGFSAGWEYMKALYAFRVQGKYDPRLEALEVKDMSGEVGASGGFLIPTAQQQQILTARGESALIRPRARVIPMASRVVPFPAVDYSNGAAGVSAFYGGVQVYWTEENADATESDAEFKFKELHARELVGYTEVPNGLIRDSAISMEAFLTGPNSFGGALAWKEDYDFLRGNGVGKPLGLLNSAAKILVNRAGAGHFAFADAVGMLAKMILSGSPVWLMSQSVIPDLYQLKDANNNAIWLPNAAGSGPTTLLGFPVLWTEKLPALGTAGDVVLADLNWYLIGDRQGMTMDVSREHKFKSSQTAFRVTEAVDGQLWLDAAITLADGSSTVSPVVVLN